MLSAFYSREYGFVFNFTEHKKTKYICSNCNFDNRKMIVFQNYVDLFELWSKNNYYDNFVMNYILFMKKYDVHIYMHLDKNILFDKINRLNLCEISETTNVKKFYDQIYDVYLSTNTPIEDSQIIIFNQNTSIANRHGSSSGNLYGSKIYIDNKSKHLYSCNYNQNFGKTEMTFEMDLSNNLYQIVREKISWWSKDYSLEKTLAYEPFDVKIITHSQSNCIIICQIYYVRCIIDLHNKQAGIKLFNLKLANDDINKIKDISNFMCNDKYIIHTYINNNIYTVGVYDIEGNHLKDLQIIVPTDNTFNHSVNTVKVVDDNFYILLKYTKKELDSMSKITYHDECRIVTINDATIENTNNIDNIKLHSKLLFSKETKSCEQIISTMFVNSKYLILLWGSFIMVYEVKTLIDKLFEKFCSHNSLSKNLLTIEVGSIENLVLSDNYICTMQYSGIHSSANSYSTIHGKIYDLQENINPTPFRLYYDIKYNNLIINLNKN